ncbi:flagellar export chaperone FliS [Actinotalea sp. M2MS4P-6]|uniref:flagellar export chaperone FliS n=1 Tax=Actinotalea sp. M2MS4P-6 TaxID=2983762 RepID=UPI0021E429FA|nr:flagellar export chaperone FliS [Actinotalea sp. M2MS4P-6]MCV2392795.1 flagellar export chaperone FliS [Actinotalea sp. M2MS4P-6]
MNYAAVRARYMDDTVATASPAKLLTMLYDRLVLDLERAENAQRESRFADASPHLTHAQDIVSELISTLDTNAWDGAHGLMSVYTFLLRELVGANVARDAERTAACRRLVEPLRDTWHQAAAQLSTPTALAPAAATPVAAGFGAAAFGASAGLGELGVA